MYKRVQRYLCERKGFIAIETILIMGIVMFFLMFFLSVLTYNYPRIMLEKEVQTLAQIAKIQGGLTDETSLPGDSDVERFKEQLARMGFDPETITIEAYQLPSGGSAMGVTPLDGVGDTYVKRDSRELIEIVVTAPATNFIFDAPMKFLGVDTEVENAYVIREVVGSERW